MTNRLHFTSSPLQVGVAFPIGSHLKFNSVISHRRERISPAEVRVKQEPASDAEEERRQHQERRTHPAPSDEQQRDHRDDRRRRDRDRHRDRDRDRHRDRGLGRDRDGELTGGRQPKQEQDWPPRGRWDDDPESNTGRERRGGEGDRGDRGGRSGGGGGEERWGLQQTAEKPAETEADKELPNFGLSGKLIEDTNTCNGVVVKYTEPPEARKPRKHWRLYVFKGDDTMPTLHIHRQSAFLMGRDRKVADIPIDHPSCSKQHAALQYRLTKTERPDGTIARVIRPYIIDLDSANGTYVNNKRIDSRRYVEIMERDVLKFGFSSREYVLLHESSQAGSNDEE